MRVGTGTDIMAKIIPSPELLSELRERKDNSKLEIGDKIAMLPFDFVKQSVITYGLEHQRLFIGRCYSFVEKGIICAINRKQSKNNEFVPLILPLTYITAFLLQKDKIYNPPLELLEKSPDQTKIINLKIANGEDISTAIQCNKVYTVGGVYTIETEILRPHTIPFYELHKFTQIALFESNLSIHFNGIDCLIESRPLNKQIFIDYIEKRMLSEKRMFGNCDTSLPSYDIITKLRTEIIKQEQTKLLHDYRVRLDCFKEHYVKDYKERGKNYCRTHYYKQNWVMGNSIYSLELPSYHYNWGMTIWGGQSDERYKNMDELTQKKAEELLQECRSDIERQERIIDYERQELQKKKQEEKAKADGWKDIGNVILFIQMRSFKGEIQFKEHSINVLQVNIIRNKFRVKVNNEYWDLKRVNISTSIFKTHYVYQVERFSHFYILEDLSKRAI